MAGRRLPSRSKSPLGHRAAISARHTSSYKGAIQAGPSFPIPKAQFRGTTSDAARATNCKSGCLYKYSRRQGKWDKMIDFIVGAVFKWNVVGSEYAFLESGGDTSALGS